MPKYRSRMVPGKVTGRPAKSVYAGSNPAHASTGGRRRYKVIGLTSDGVKILRPITKPDHFTYAQIRAAIKFVNRGKI
jgi:hypothetical protein